MEVLDMFGEITAKNIVKTDTGDNRIFGVMAGVVTDNYDSELPGRVCVRLPVRDENANELKWARMAFPYAGKKWGEYLLPEAGDQVLVCFEQGNIEKPYVIGCVPRERDSFLTRAAHEKNRYKRLVTKNGSTLQFEDGEADDGGGDKISLFTAGNALRFLMDNENKKLLFGDRDSQNGMELKTEQGRIQIKAEKKLTIEVGDSIKISLNAVSGTVSIKCSKFKVEAGNEFSAESGGRLRISGGDVVVEAMSQLSAESSGMASFGGATTSIGKL